MVASRVRRGRAVGKILVGLLFVLGITGSSSEALSADDILQIPDSEAMANLGRAFRSVGRMEEARKLLYRAATLDPQDQRIRARLKAVLR